MSTAVRHAPRLPDGTPYVGKLGELAYDPDEDKVQCHLCGGWYHAIGSSHLPRTHGWTLAEYRDAFRLPMQLATCSRHMSQRLRANAVSLVERGDFGKGVGVSIERRAARVRPWRTLAAQRPELVTELHPTRNRGIDPTAIAAKSARKLWWRCGVCGHEWHAAVGSRSDDHGCPECYNARRRNQGPRQVPGNQSIGSLRPDLAAEWNQPRNKDLDPDAISPNSKQKVWWRCGVCGHEWQAAIQNRAGGHGCPKCGIKRSARSQSRVDYDRSLAARNPEIAAELHPTRNPGIAPTQLGARSSLKLWWHCGTCGHDWKTAVSTRTDGSGCPACYRATHRRTAARQPEARRRAGARR